MIGESFWHAGWKVTLDEATFAAGDFRATVTMDATFENLGADTATFDSQTVLTAGGDNFEGERFGEGLPEVPGGLTGNGELIFEVTNEFAFDDAVLIIGNAENNQAFIPIGPDATEELVTLEPQAVAVSGPIVVGALTINVESAEVRADLPDTHSEIENGNTSITFQFSASPAAGIQIGQGVLQSDAFALKLPDGTAVAVRSDGRSGVNELLQGKEGTTIPDLSVRFEIPLPAEGAYALVVRGNYGPGGTVVEGELPFTIP
jgi:hypothetical protein